MAAYQRDIPEAPTGIPTGDVNKKPESMAAAAGTSAESDLAAGEKLFATNCAVCHGPEGKGGIGPDLTARDYKYGRAVEAITESIVTGRPGGMPGFGNQLSAQEITNLAGFVESL